MNTAVGLVKAYLELCGYFVLAELPIRHPDVTDIDVVAVRFPHPPVGQLRLVVLAGHGIAGARSVLTLPPRRCVEFIEDRMRLAPQIVAGTPNGKIRGSASSHRSLSSVLIALPPSTRVALRSTHARRVA